jgi:hypothetical protein
VLSVVFAACVPLQPENGSLQNGAPGASLASPVGTGDVAQSTPHSGAAPSASSNASSASKTIRTGSAKDRVPNIAVGAAPGYHVALHLTAPPQVCDLDAFADGVRDGYASTWNGLVGALPGADGDAASPALGKPMFDPASVHTRGTQYALHWDGGDQPSNACAAYGYLIGKAMGTHRAYADAKAPAGG